MKYVSEFKELENERFDSVEALKEAEEKVEKARDEKKQLAVVRKDAAESVKAVISDRVKVEADARKAKNEAYKKYLAECDEADKRVKEAYDAEQKALNEFCEKYPDGFHDTISIGDVTVRYDYSNKPVVTHYDPFARLFKTFFDFTF